MTRSPKPGFRPRNRLHLVLVPTQPRGGGTVHGADLTVPWWNPRGEVAAGHDPSSRPGRHLRAITQLVVRKMGLARPYDLHQRASRPGSTRGARQPGRRVGGDTCLLYTSPSPRDGLLSRMPSSA